MVQNIADRKRRSALKITFALLVFVSGCATLPGCTSRAWYEGLRNIERQNCHRMASTTERLECLEREDDMSYERYRKEREAAQNH